ncbi:MAG: hypothetical protein ACRCSK_04870 [Fusobacteriaceae bacterium]
MKKILMGIILLSAVTIAQGKTGKYNIYPKVGVQLLGNYSDYNTMVNQKVIGDTAGSGFEFGVEWTYNFIGNYEVGIGVGYNINSKHAEVKYDSTSDTIALPSYNSIPIYMANKYYFGNFSDWEPYGILDIGYSINKLVNNAMENGKNSEENSTLYKDASFSNGIYFGVGAGVEVKNFVVEIAYKITGADYSRESTTVYHSYSRITLELGYKFSFGVFKNFDLDALNLHRSFSNQKY